MVYQMMFAVITPALITGAFAERFRFSAFLVFSLLWALLVYNPVAHWVWGIGGWIRNLGALDFAGGPLSTSRRGSLRWRPPSSSGNGRGSGRTTWRRTTFR